VIAEEGGNILHIHHEEGEEDVPVLETRVEMEIETRGGGHGEQIRKAVLDKGYGIE